MGLIMLKIPTTAHRNEVLQPRRSLVGEWWINKLWHIHIAEYYSALNRNKLSRHEETCRNLKCILLSERSQSWKATYCMILTIWHYVKDKTRDSKKISGCQKFGREGGMNRWNTGNFYTGDSILDDIVMVDTWQRMTLNVNYNFRYQNASILVQ